MPSRTTSDRRDQNSRSSPAVYAESTQIFLSSISSLQKSSEFSDLKIYCGQDTYAVHKAIVCTRSQFFAAACKHGEESIKNEITLNEVDPRLVRLLIDYMYMLDYQWSPDSKRVVTPDGKESEVIEYAAPQPESPVQRQIKLFESGEFSSSAEPSSSVYGQTRSNKRKQKKASRSSFFEGSIFDDIPPPIPEELPSFDERFDPTEAESRTVPFTPSPPLPPSAKASIEGTGANGALESAEDLERQSKNEENVFSSNMGELSVHAHMYALAEFYHIPDLKSVAKHKFADTLSEDWNSDEFVTAAEIVYTSTVNDDGLRSLILTTIDAHSELLDKNKVRDLLTQKNELSVDLLYYSWRRHGW